MVETSTPGTCVKKPLNTPVGELAGAGGGRLRQWWELRTDQTLPAGM